MILTLKGMGLDVVMITGDNSRTANAVASQIGIKRVMSEVLPEDKSNEIQKLQSRGQVLAMVGDGINDAPALAQSDVGIAIGTVTDVAMETSNITLLGDNIAGIPKSIKPSQLTVKIIKQNLFFAFIYNTIAIPLAAGVLYPFTGILLSPVIASAAMAASSVSVVTNSLRLRKRSVILP
ncbi:MAG: HAD-IC family P-type ATPase [Candidatus Marinimicrobia bacterium]|nr:HAD-IC family P-type ATPase [Candidatus Neomarinimicrobiota bacterium]